MAARARAPSRRERGITFPQLVRDAVEHELDRGDSSRRLSSIGVISTGGRARRRDYEPDVWR